MDDGMVKKQCLLDHHEFGIIDFEVPREVTVDICPWHNADGTFDREAYLETIYPEGGGYKVRH